MVCSASFLGMVALAAAYITAPANAAGEPVDLPWSGRVTSIQQVMEHYQTHIFIQRNGSTNGKVEDYVNVEADARVEVYNEDKSVIDIGVDGKAIYQTETTYRRSELVQIVKMDTTGTTLFRGSLMKKEPFKNKKKFAVMHSEEKSFEIQIDAELNKIMFVNNGTTEAKWESDLAYGCWYNFAVGISRVPNAKNMKLDFYMSEGSAELVLISSDEVITEYTEILEFHVGLLAFSPDGSEVVMEEEQDIISISGVSIVSGLPTGGTPACSSDGPPPASADSPPATAGSPPATAGSPPATAGSPPVTAGSPPETAGSPPVTAGSPPDTSGSPPVTAGSPPVPDAGGNPASTPGTAGNTNPGNPEQNDTPAP